MRRVPHFHSPATLFLCAAAAVATSCGDPALRDRQCSGQESYRVGFYRVNGGPRVTYYANRGGIRAAPGDTVVYESDGGSPRAPVCTGDVSVSRDDLTFTFRFGAGEASCQLSYDSHPIDVCARLYGPLYGYRALVGLSSRPDPSDGGVADVPVDGSTPQDASVVDATGPDVAADRPDPPEASLDVPTDAAPDALVDVTPADAEPVACPTSTPTAGTSRMLGSGSGLYLNRRLAVGGGYVAWADGRSLQIAPADGASPAITVDTGAVTAIAMFGADLYWVQATAADQARLKRHPLAAPASEPAVSVSLSLRIVNNLVVTSDYIFALDDYNGRLIAAPRGSEHLSFPLANLTAGGQFRNMTLLREEGSDRLVFERYALGTPCYLVQSVPVPPPTIQVTHAARTDYEPAAGPSCTGASFYGLAADARGVVFHDPAGSPSLRAFPPPTRLGGGRGDGTGVGLWRDCVVVFNGAGYTAVERGGAHGTRTLAGAAGGALFTVVGDAVYAVLGSTSGTPFSVVRIEL